MSLSLPGVERAKVGSLWDCTLLKVPIVLKNTSNKNCIKLNFQQKTQ